MVLARRRAEWERTAWICHVVINANPFRGEDAEPITPAQCNPLLADETPAAAPTSGIDCTDPAEIAAYHDALLIRKARVHGR